MKVNTLVRFSLPSYQKLFGAKDYYKYNFFLSSIGIVIDLNILDNL